MSWKRPRNTWNAKEIKELIIPVAIKKDGFDIERRAQFEKEFFARTACRYDEIMPLNRALILIWMVAPEKTEKEDIVPRLRPWQRILYLGDLDLIFRHVRIMEFLNKSTKYRGSTPYAGIYYNLYASYGDYYIRL
jgi:hypothetical protein